MFFQSVIFPTHFKSRKWVGKVTHLVLKMGRENYMFGLTVGKLRAALRLNFVWEKRKSKTSVSRGGTRRPLGRENYIFGPKMNHL